VLVSQLSVSCLMYAVKCADWANRLAARHVESLVEALFSSNACVGRNLSHFIVYLTIYANLWRICSAR